MYGPSFGGDKTLRSSENQTMNKEEGLTSYIYGSDFNIPAIPPDDINRKN
jgi:hypothetical protein